LRFNLATSVANCADTGETNLKGIKIGFVALTVLAACTYSLAIAAEPTLNIYFIDVEGGQSTLIVTPQGQSLLIDAGFPGGGGFEASVGDPNKARDAQRVVAAAHDAGINHIDYLLITHFHPDHMGGVPELAQLMPIDAFVDHGTFAPEAVLNVKGTETAFEAYAKVRAKGRHIEPKPGDRLPLKGVDALVVTSDRATITKPLSAATGRNAACTGPARAPDDPNENPRSTGIVLQFGKFRFLDVGDLSGPPLYALACPSDLIGSVDAYLVPHHGGSDAVEPATFAAFKPRVAIVNNGATKGGTLELIKALHQLSGDTWQLHRSTAAGKDNFADDRIANLDETAAHWLKLSANSDGSFQILNARTGATTKYKAR
jgi:beta-lactamase superfamily II metal-dependent hydrolase